MEMFEIGTVVKEETMAKNGPGKSYPDTFKNALHEGTEFEVLDSQSDWYQVSLKNGKVCWLEKNTVEVATLKLFTF